MMVLFKIWPENIKKALITLQALRFKPNSLNQTCISLKSIMQLTKTIFSNSAIFIEKKRVANWLLAKVKFCGQNKMHSIHHIQVDSCIPDQTFQDSLHTGSHLKPQPVDTGFITGRFTAAILTRRSCVYHTRVHSGDPEPTILDSSQTDPQRRSQQDNPGFITHWPAAASPTRRSGIHHTTSFNTEG